MYDCILIFSYIILSITKPSSNSSTIFFIYLACQINSNRFMEECFLDIFIGGIYLFGRVDCQSLHLSFFRDHCGLEAVLSMGCPSSSGHWSGSHREDDGVEGEVEAEAEGCSEEEGDRYWEEGEGEREDWSIECWLFENSFTLKGFISLWVVVMGWHDWFRWMIPRNGRVGVHRWKRRIRGKGVIALGSSGGLRHLQHRYSQVGLLFICWLIWRNQYSNQTRSQSINRGKNSNILFFIIWCLRPKQSENGTDS